MIRYRFFLKPNSLGFSLVEIMVVLGISGVIITGMASAFVSIHKEQSRIAARQDLSALINDVRTRLLSSTTCMSVIGGEELDAGGRTKAREKIDSSASHPGKKVSIKLANGETLYPYYDHFRDVAGTKLRAEYLSLVNLENAGVDSSGVPIYFVNIYGGFSMNLNGTFHSLGKHSLGGVMVKVDSVTNHVSGCFSASVSSQSSDSFEQLTDAMAETMCDRFSGTWDGSANGGKGSCDLPSTASTPSASSLCATLGFVWSGSSCQASTSGGGGGSSSSGSITGMVMIDTGSAAGSGASCTAVGAGLCLSGGTAAGCQSGSSPILMSSDLGTGSGSGGSSHYNCVAD